MEDSASPGRRERKKAATRQAIVDAALELFLERGFDAVSVREIADRADVSPTTVFAHFTQKEALPFYEEDEQRERLIAAVTDRAAGGSISDRLKSHYRSEHRAAWAGEDGELRGRVMALIEATPALQDYASRMWVRHEDALAAAIATELGLPDPSDEIRLYSRFALQIQLLVSGDSDPMLDTGFSLLDNGWGGYVEQASG
jgi:AcrR family transcriptional regulator